MIEPTEVNDLRQVGHEDLEKRLAVLTEELRRANKAIQEKACELRELTVSLEAQGQKRRRDVEAADENLRRVDELKWAFWTIE
jgi:hypothetical protein